MTRVDLTNDSIYYYNWKEISRDKKSSNIFSSRRINSIKTTRHPTKQIIYPRIDQLLIALLQHKPTYVYSLRFRYFKRADFSHDEKLKQSRDRWSFEVEKKLKFFVEK